MFSFHLKNDDIVPNAETINNFLETIMCSYLREWFDNIILK